MDDEMKAARAAWWSVVNWDHLDELTACEAWDAAERVHRAIVADIPGEAERDALHMRLAAAEDTNAACNADCARVRAERNALRAALSEAIVMVKHWGGYAPNYYQQKWDLEGDLDKLRAAIDAARVRYSVQWYGPAQPICSPMPDGYWTPWHVATAEIDDMRAERDRLRTQLAEVIARAERAEANAANWEEQANDRVSDWDEVRAERDALRADAERFAWYFGSEDKMPFMKAYIDGLASGYTLDQWRAAIDAAIAREKE